MSTQMLAGILMLIVTIAVWAGIIYGIYSLIKRLIRYNADYQDRYRRYREAEQEAAELEAELKYMAEEYDWSKEP